MDVKRAIKKVVALATATGLVGATLAGALAADLEDYPSPFVQSGVLSPTDSVIVIGESAATSDVMGAIEIAASLQAAAVSVEAVEVDATVEPTIDEGVEISKSGDKVNYGETLNDVQSTALDDSDLDLLEEGTYSENRGETSNDADYEQTLTLEAGTATFQFDQPEDEEAGDYLYLQKGVTLYTYLLEFTDAVDWDSDHASDDFEGSKIEIQGNEYTITDAKFTATDTDLDELTLVAGDTTRWLQQDQPLTVGDHTIMVINVNDDGSMCGVEVDGATQWVNVGSTATIGGLEIGVLDAIAVHSKDYDQDTCEISIGSQEIVLSNGNRVVVNDDEVDGSEVTITSSSSEWTQLQITYEVDDDDIYLAPGEAWTDPVFGNFKIVFAGTTATTEDMEMSANGDEAEFTYINNDGEEVTVYWHNDGATENIMLGTDDDELILLPGEQVVQSNVEGTMLLYTTDGGETHLLEISDIDTTNNKTDIKDLTYGTTYDDKAFTRDQEVTSTIALGSLGSLAVKMDEDNVTFLTTYGNGVPETKYGATLSFNDSRVLIYEEDVVETTEVGEDNITLQLKFDTSDDELQLYTPSSTAGLTMKDASEDDDDTQYAVTTKGTLVEWDNEDSLWAKVTYPEEDVYANVFVAPLSAQVTQGAAGELTTEKVNKIPVGLAVLDSNAESMNKNMIVVGGPCVNTLAAELADNPADCTEGFESGKAKLKYYTRNGKVALLVAGYDAQDTLGASYVLRDYEDYALLGDEVEVVVASLTDISVTTV
ncbi:hypothetical protein JW930_05350 [Candidatus Woesearchaeota archaeon]|nr:hypothetical protein [Candidatus Woesearchaeota archaeon]